MRLISSMAYAGLLGFLMAGSMARASAGDCVIIKSCGLNFGPFIGTSTTNTAPFSLESLSSLSSSNTTIDSAGYQIQVGLKNGASVTSGSTSPLSPFTDSSNEYMYGPSFSVPTIDLKYTRNNKSFTSTSFDLLWNYTAIPSIPTTLSFYSTSGNRQNTISETDFEKISGPEWVQISNLSPFDEVTVTGGGSDYAFVPGVLVPEPGSLCILGSGLMMLGGVVRARRRRNRG